MAGVGSVLSAHAESRRLPDLRHARAAVARRRSGLTRISILDTRFPRCAHGGRLRLLCVVLKPYERLETGAAAVMAEAFMPDANPHMRVDHPAAAAATHRPSGSNHAEAGETPDGAGSDQAAVRPPEDTGARRNNFDFIRFVLASLVI